LDTGSAAQNTQISPAVAEAMAGQADIQKTGLIGSLEIMGTREAQK
jgi:hypothetical protein